VGEGKENPYQGREKEKAQPAEKEGKVSPFAMGRGLRGKEKGRSDHNNKERDS